jgi:two-component system, OmpR family, sensor histidine kinase SenX3
LARGLGLARGEAGDDGATALRNDFIANVAHELKTPVGAVALLADALTLEDDPEVQRRLADRIAAETERLGRLIDDLIGFSDEPIAVGAPSFVSVEEIVSEAVARIRLAAHAKDIKIEIEWTAEDVVLEGRHRELVSALVNLLENGVKYSSEHGRIDVAVRRGEGCVEIAVQDDGMGIPAGEIDRIFERCFRGEQARALPGHGLGLAIVQQVAESHAGQIVAASTLGSGSVFTLRLPAGL